MPKKITFNEAQIKELKNLLNSGMKQTEIAKHFEVTDDTIRRICRENDLKIRMPHKCTCVICGATFYSNVKNARTCNKEHHRTCVICHNDFIVDRNNIRETCSNIECISMFKYGVKHFLQSDSVKDKRKQTVSEKYGVENVSQLSSTKEKVKQTNSEKHGGSYLSTEEGINKRKATNLKRYGFEERFSDADERNKIAQTNLEKYGTEFPMQSAEIKNKQRATLLDRYGVSNAMKCPDVVSKLRKANYARFGNLHIVIKNEQDETSVNRAFGELLDSHKISYQKEFPLNGFSFDFKCGNTLVEIDPSATHNSAVNIFPDCPPTAPEYHLNKTKAALENGYRCIHIFDWEDWDKIVTLLTERKRVYARKCSIENVTKEIAEEFTEKYHIQGSCKGQEKNLGLFYEGELVEIMTFGTPRYNRKYDFELLRLCTKSDTEVVGGASKLFKHFIEEHQDQTIISYCDLSKFSGKVYEEIGMKLDHISSPNKVWSKGSRYITDNLLRQRGYDQIFGTNFGKGASNEELMLKAHWLPVFDCGQKVFTY